MLMDRPPTPAATLHRAREIGMEEGLHYVYVGNVPGEGGENTHCYACGGMHRYCNATNRYYLVW